MASFALMTRWLGGLVIAGSLAVSPFAFAAEPDTIVTLKNGDMARGVLIERTTGDHVTLQLPSGESRTYPWADIDAVKPIPPQVATAPPVAAAPPPPAGAVVHLVSDDSAARVAKLAGRGEGSFATGTGYGSITLEVVDMVCRAPCNRIVPAGSYRIIGDGLIDSDEFDVPSAGEVTVHATMRGRGRKSGGRAGLFIGVPFIVLGGGLLAVGVVTADTIPHTSSYLLLGAGGGLLGLGLIGTALGIYFLATAHSDVTVTPGNSPAAVLARGGAFVF